MDANEMSAFENMMKSLRKLENVHQELIEKLRNFYLSMTYEEMKKEMRYLETEHLEDLCSTLNAIKHENYELCQAAQDILNERKYNP